MMLGLLTNSLTSRYFLFLFLLSLMTAFAVAAQSGPTSASSWSGVIVYSSCNADEAFAESPECFQSALGTRLSLYDDTSRVMYSLEPQGIPAGHLGDMVTIRGTLDGGSIHVTSLEPVSIGLAVGQRAPAFSARDQFGQTHSLNTLKGPKGTVLLFFRSADW